MVPRGWGITKNIFERKSESGKTSGDTSDDAGALAGELRGVQKEKQIIIASTKTWKEIK